VSRINASRDVPPPLALSPHATHVHLPHTGLNAAANRDHVKALMGVELMLTNVTKVGMIGT
jgi:hypothetical protein